MNNYEEKKQARIDYYNEKAVEAGKRSEALTGEADKMLSAISFGQPILIGHYSENRDRNYRNKAQNKFEKGYQESEKAEYYAQKAQAAQNNHAISSDDPEAVTKLQHKLEYLKDRQEDMKQANAYYRKHNTMQGYQNITDEQAAEMDENIKSDRSCKKMPYPSYALQNNNQNMQSIKKRIKSLENLNERNIEGWSFDGGEVVMNAEENRIQVLFDQKPDEECRNDLKKWGFKWAASNKAWQRQLNNNGIYAVKQVKSLKPQFETTMPTGGEADE